MSYGSSSYNSFVLNPARVATQVQEKKKESTGLTSFFRILVVVFEVGASLLMPETMVGFEALGAQIGIGLIGASANTALSASSGSLSGVGVGIDFGSAFLPAMGQLRTAYKIGAATTSETAAKLASRQLSVVESSERGLLEKQAGAYERQSNIYHDKMMARIKMERVKAQGARAAGGFTKATDYDIVGNEIKTLIYNARETKDIEAIMEIRELETTSKGYGRLAALKRAEILDEFGTTETRIQATVKEWARVFEKIKEMPMAKMLTKSSFFKELEKISGPDKSEVIKNIYLQSLRSKGTAQFARLSVTSKKLISDTMGMLSEDSQTILRSTLAKIGSNGLSRSQIAKEVDDVIKIIIELHPEDAVHILKLNQADFARSFQVFGKNADPNTFNRYVKQAGSREFNDKIVQNLQLIDPNDLGRAPVERAYQYLKEKINSRIEKSVWEGAAKATKKGIKKVDKLEEAFINSGGLPFPANRYLLGYKTIHEIGPDNYMVLIKFNKLYTASGSGKNKAGKQDIMINCTKHDLKMFAEEGRKYWFRVGKRRGWMYSRGGKRHGMSVGTVTNELSLFLGFVPIPALRNVLSIVSNWIENISSMVKGDYFSGYWAKLEGSFTRSLINRSARLFTRVVTGGLYTKGKKVAAAAGASEKALASGLKSSSSEYQALVRTAMNTAGKKAAWVGREFQRVATITLSTFEGKNSSGSGAFTGKGTFRFTSGKTASGSGFTNLVKKIAFSGAPTSIKGAMIRHGNSQGKIKGREIIGAKRNFSQLGRIYSAFTPAGTVKPLRSITKIG